MIDVVTLYFWDPKTYQIYAPALFDGNINQLGTHQHVYNYKSHSIYYPHVELRQYIATYPKQLTTLLVVKVSLPKLIYGNNLMELRDIDFQACCWKLSDILFQMGVRVTPGQVSRYADVRSFEYGKNILLGCIPVSFVLSELSRAQPLQHYMDIQHVVYQNGGEKVVFYSKGYELVFYDKTKELQKEIKQPHCILPQQLKTDIETQKINILRIEIRFHKRKSWQKLLYPYNNLIRFATFRDVFQKTLARRVLLDYWHKVSDSIRSVPMDIYAPAFELWRISRGAGKKLKPQALLAKLGTNYLMRGSGYQESVRSLQRLGFSNPSDFIKRNTGRVFQVNWRLDVWRFIDHSLGIFTSLIPSKWRKLKKRTSAAWFKRYESMLTIQEVANQLHVSKGQIHQAIKENKLPAYKIGRRLLRIKRTDITMYLDGCLK